VEGELGEPLLADGADDALDVHLAEAEEEDGAALAVVVVPPTGEIVPHHRRYLDKQKMSFFLSLIKEKGKNQVTNHELVLKFSINVLN
jgi:hypothetical protein